MNYEAIDIHTYNQCCRAKLKVTLGGCHLKEGDEVLVFHKFRIFKPAVVGALGEGDKYLAFDVDGQLFDRFFTMTAPTPLEQIRLKAQAAAAANAKK